MQQILEKINTAGLQNNQVGGNGQAPAPLDIVVANEQCFGEVFWGFKTWTGFMKKIVKNKFAQNAAHISRWKALQIRGLLRGFFLIRRIDLQFTLSPQPVWK